MGIRGSVRSALIRRSFQLYREQLNQIEAIPYDTWLIERLMKSETPQLLERMSFNDIWHMEDFVDNDQLSIALSELNIRQKFILYWKFVENASDYQIGCQWSDNKPATSLCAEYSCRSLFQFMKG